MSDFSRKLRIIYKKMFHEDIDKFTEAFIDENKFDKEKFITVSLQEGRKQFFLNRKTVLRRWLNNEMLCTSDFQKSFSHYKISKYQFHGEGLLSVDDFRQSNNLLEFEKKIEEYIYQEERTFVRTEYQYIYVFNEPKEEVNAYHIVNWRKGEGRTTIIDLEHSNQMYKGTLTLEENNNIFITIQINSIRLYLLFHDNNDSSCDYTVGTSMGYLEKDNKVPHAEKVLLAKKKLDSSDIELQFILNETESISAIENRFNLNQDEIKINHFLKFSNKFKQYSNFFTRLVERKYHQKFYYRLAFREFYAFHRLFEKVVNHESYFISNYQRAFLELIRTVESIHDIPIYIVTPLDEGTLFMQYGPKELKIKDRFLNLSNYGIETNIIFIVESLESILPRHKKVLNEMVSHNIEVRLIERESIVHEVNSLDFFFIQNGDSRDFVLVDPIRDNKEVFKLFTNEIPMDEYRTDYRCIYEESERYIIED